MKQKIVIKLQLCCNKCKISAMQIASGVSGVTSVAVEGPDQDQLVVTGECIDVAKLICALKKKLCTAAIKTVEEVKPKPPPCPTGCCQKPPGTCCCPKPPGPCCPKPPGPCCPKVCCPKECKPWGSACNKYPEYPFYCEVTRDPGRGGCTQM